MKQQYLLDKKNDFLNDTLFSGSNLDICENEILEINKLANILFDENDPKVDTDILISKINLYSKKIFDELYLLNDDKYFKFFLDEIYSKYFFEIKEIKNYFSKFNFNKVNKTNSQLYNKGYYFGNLEQETLKQILKIAEKYIPIFKLNIKNKKTSREDLSINRGKNIRKIIKILNKHFYNQGVNKDISVYMQKNFEVTGCSLEMSTEHSTWWKWDGSQGISQHTLYAHLDQSLLCPKSICYLSDVDEKSGPTSFYPNLYEELKLNFVQNIFGRVLSSIGKNKKSKLYEIYNNSSNRAYNCEEYFKHINLLPKNLRFDSHIGWYVKNNSKLEKKFIERELKMIGIKGKYVIFDGSRIIHRGGCVSKGERLALQITFGIKQNLLQKIWKKITKNF